MENCLCVKKNNRPIGLTNNSQKKSARQVGKHERRTRTALAQSRRIADMYAGLVEHVEKDDAGNEVKKGCVSEAYVKALSSCGAYMSWLATPKRTLRSLLSARFCHKRLCPICMIRRARREEIVFDQLMRAAEEACPTNLLPVDATTPLSEIEPGPYDFAEKSPVAFVFMTLTASSPEMCDLHRFISFMAVGHRALTQQPWWRSNVRGSIRKLGVTINKDTGLPHPHYHYILAVPEYFLRKNNFAVPFEGVYGTWSRVMSSAGYNVTKLHGVDIRYSEADAAYRSVYRSCVGQKLPSAEAKIRAEAARREVLERFLTSQKMDSEPGLSKFGAHFPRELAQYMVQMWDSDQFNALTSEVLELVHEGLKHVKFTSYQGLFRQLRQRQLCGRLILRPISDDSEELKFRYIENFVESRRSVYDLSLLDLGEDLPLAEAKKKAREVLSEYIEPSMAIDSYNRSKMSSCLSESHTTDASVQPDLEPLIEPGLDYKAVINLFFGASNAVSLDEKKATTVHLSYYQRYKLARYLARNNINLVSFDRFCKIQFHQVFFTYKMILRILKDYPSWTTADVAAAVSSDRILRELDDDGARPSIADVPLPKRRGLQ